MKLKLKTQNLNQPVCLKNKNKYVGTGLVLANNRGITLVALIITIIVLLILAVVAITSISKSNIIKHAQNGRDAYKQGETNETAIITGYEKYLDDNNPTKDDSDPKDEDEIDFYNYVFADDDFDTTESSHPSVYYVDKSTNKFYNLCYRYGKFEINGSDYEVFENVVDYSNDKEELNKLLEESFEIDEVTIYKGEIKKLFISEDEDGQYIAYVVGKDAKGEYIGFIRNGLNKSYKIGKITDERIANTGLKSEDLAKIPETH